MKLFSTLFLLLLLFCSNAWADNFVLRNGESSKAYVMRTSDDSQLTRADRLFAADYAEVFSASLIHTPHIEDARIIACTYDNAALRKYARLRGISFEHLAGRCDAFIMKVNNNGSQLFVIGSDERGVAFGLMTLSRMWGVSPFRWWVDAPALPQQQFELDVVYERFFEASVPQRTLYIDGVQPHSQALQDLVLRLRATHLATTQNEVDAVSPSFSMLISPADQPYLGLSLALYHPDRLRLEATRAYNHALADHWMLCWQPQMGGELQASMFFDMAWDITPFLRDPYSVEHYIDEHFAQMSGIRTSWYQLWNDYFDLVINVHPERPLSVESLRRSIGESQSLALQLSMELNNKVVAPIYSQAFFRTIEYPINVLTTQIQRLCNLQLFAHQMVTQWQVDDCAQRLQLLVRQLPQQVGTRWSELFMGVPVPEVMPEASLLQRKDGSLSPLQVGNDQPLPEQDTDVMLYRSTRAIGTLIEPFQALQLPLNHQTASLRLRCAFLPVRQFGKPIYCMLSVDNAEPQLLAISSDDVATQQCIDVTFDVDPTVENHRISFRTSSPDGVLLQRVWLLDYE